MENKDIENKVDILLSQISKANKELEEIRKYCKHQNIKIIAVGDNFEIREVCESCKQIVGYPSQSEIDEYIVKGNLDLFK